MAQGKSRLERGVAYAKYVNQKFGAKHRLEIVPACGHNGRCMYTSEGCGWCFNNCLTVLVN